jgi:hypothetical protein
MAPLEGLPLLSWCNLLSLHYFWKNREKRCQLPPRTEWPYSSFFEESDPVSDFFVSFPPCFLAFPPGGFEEAEELPDLFA